MRPKQLALAPLGNSDTTTLLGELLGSHSSVGDVTAIVAERAGGNPFFAEEMVRELVQRGVRTGTHGEYVCGTDVAELNVPATVQAAIAARIDGLTLPARRTLNAASVIGARFGAELVQALNVEPVFDELLSAELIDQVRFTPSSEYAFRHPLIGAVAYESQLKSDRAELHRLLAATVQERDPGSVEENAALIAGHLEAAGDLHAAYGWHMRAAASSANRDVGAARVSWERARRIADGLPDDSPEQLSMRIAPRTMLCVTDWQSRAIQQNSGRFAELRELCSAAGDKVSLAIGMTGLATDLLYAEHASAGSQLASEQMALLESIGDPTLTIGLAFVAFANWFNAGQIDEISTWSQIVIDLAEGDSTKGAGFGLGSPLAIALAFRGVARWWQGCLEWQHDLEAAVAMARHSDAGTLGLVVAWTYGLAIHYGVLQADDSAVRACEEAVQTADDASSGFAVMGTRFTLGLALLNHDTAVDRDRGLQLMVRARDVWLPKGAPSLVPVAAVVIAREMARRGEHDGAIAVMRSAVGDLHREERLGWAIMSTSSLVETLLQRGAEGDLAEAQQAVDWLANLPTDEGSAIREITLLRLRTLQARARGDNVAFRDLAGRYRAMAESLGFEGHIAWAKEMTE